MGSGWTGHELGGGFQASGKADAHHPETSLDWLKYIRSKIMTMLGNIVAELT